MKLITIYLCLLVATPVFGQVYTVTPLGDGQDHTRVITAMNDCSINYPDGCSIELLPGTHVWTGTGVGWSDKRDNIRLFGHGPETTVVDCSGTDIHRGCVNYGLAGGDGLLENTAIVGIEFNTNGHVDNPGLFKGVLMNYVNLSMSGVEYRNLRLLADSKGMSGIAFAGGVGTISDLKITDVKIKVNHFYGVQLRKGVGSGDIKITGLHVEMPDAGYEAANALAIYAGNSRVHVSDSTLIADHGNAHSPFACSPCSNLTASGLYVRGSQRAIEETPAGECGIEVEYKVGHEAAGSETITERVSITNSIVEDAHYGICVMRRDTSGVGSMPRTIMIDGNIVDGTTDSCIYVDNAEAVYLGDNLLTDCGGLPVRTENFAEILP